MIKSNGGDGYLRNVVLDSFLARGTAYGLDVDQHWSGQTPVAGDGVSFSNITFSVSFVCVLTSFIWLTRTMFCWKQNWDGAVVDGVQRPPVQFLCADGAPCTDMQLVNVNLWSATNEAVVKCESAFGSGLCLESGTPTSYAVTTSSITQPAGFTTPPSLPGDLTEGFATDSPIPIP